MQETRNKENVLYACAHGALDRPIELISETYELLLRTNDYEFLKESLELKLLSEAIIQR